MGCNNNGLVANWHGINILFVILVFLFMLIKESRLAKVKATRGLLTTLIQI